MAEEGTLKHAAEEMARLTDAVRAEEESSREGRRVTDELRDELRSILREIRGELARIRTRLDSLVAIEKELGYQGGRLSAIEKRFATMATTTFHSPPAA